MSKSQPSDGSSRSVVTLVLPNAGPIRMALVRELIHLAETISKIVNRHRLKPLDSYQQGVLETYIESAAFLFDAIRAIDGDARRAHG
jgi:hypothetical protein